MILLICLGINSFNELNDVLGHFVKLNIDGEELKSHYSYVNPGNSV